MNGIVERPKQGAAFRGDDRMDKRHIGHQYSRGRGKCIFPKFLSRKSVLNAGGGRRRGATALLLHSLLADGELVELVIGGCWCGRLVDEVEGIHTNADQEDAKDKEAAHGTPDIHRPG